VISARSGCRTPRRAVWLTAFGLAAVFAPPALASDGTVGLATPPVPDATELANAVLGDTAVAEHLPVVPVELPSALPAAPAEPAVEEPAPSGAVAAPLPEPAPDPVPTQAVDTPAEAPLEPQPEAPLQYQPPAVQHEPTNVNVSIRVESPGDDGTVTQVNAAIAPSPSDQAGQYQAEPDQYQPVVAPPVAAPAPAAPAPDAPEAEPDDGWEWSWNWDCGSAPLDAVTLPAGLSQQSWTWIWNWNCGNDEESETTADSETASGYQPVSIQYRPVNINVSIRINSPGANGPVVQTNVAVSVAARAPVTAQLPAAAQSPASGQAAAPAAEPAAAPPVESAPSALVAVAPAPVDERDDCCLLPELRGAAFSPSTLAAGPPAAASSIGLLPADTVVVAARLELRVRRAAHDAADRAVAPARPQARPSRPAETRRGAEEHPSVVTQAAGLGAVPLGGPERNLPFAALVFLAFAFASASSTFPSVRSRPTPSADGDDPPDRPG
jgi:hypothetical protein